MTRTIALLVLIFCCTSLAVKAQGNLQFNRAINYSLTCATPGSSTPAQQSVTVTVPAGKVWKIESYHISYSSPSSPTFYFSPSGSSLSGNINIDKAVVTNGDAAGSGTQTAIWLAAGTHTFTLVGYANSSIIYTYYGLITGIEFNITQ